MRDQETGIDFFNARYFAAALARFTSVDPANAGADMYNPQSWNGYGYVGNNPLALVDPTGMGWKSIQIQVCSPLVATTICYEPRPAPPGSGNMSQCHYETYNYWVDDDGPGTRGGHPNGPGKAPPKSGNCIAASPVQRKLLPIQATAAKFWGKTLLAGLGASGGAGLGKGIGVYGSESAQIAVSPNGNAAYAITFAAPAAVTGGGTYAWVTPSTKGLGSLGGSQFGVSNVSDPSQLAGVSYDGSASVAAGLGVGADLSVGDGSWQFNVTLGFGAGGRGSAGARTYTAVVPICGSW